jgi:chaperone required for assembly of F1-ATPase
MRDIFEDIFSNQPFDPVEAARRALRPKLRQKFFREATVAPHAEGFAVLLDGKPVRTPGRRMLAAPTLALAQAIAAEWQNLTDVIDPLRMPMTRLANTVIDGVAGAEDPVVADIAKYLGSDLVFYRATQPEGLVSRQSQHWDPLIAFARENLGARFVLAADVMPVTQPAEAVAAAARAVPRDPWRLGAAHVVTTLTGSALIALALAAESIDVDAAWAAAHVDEDWNMDFWGRDEPAMERRASRLAEMQAAATVLRLVPQT